MKSKDITIIKPMCFFFIPPHTPQSTELVVDLYNLLLLFFRLFFPILPSFSVIKPFKNFEELMELLRSKGLIVNVPVYACKALKGYTCVSNFAREVHFKQFEADLIAARKDNKNEAFVKHHNSKYSGVLPVWAMVETLSF